MSSGYETFIAVMVPAHAAVTVALGIKVGQYMQRIVQLEAKVAESDSQAYDVVLAAIGVRLEHHGRTLEQMQEHLKTISDFLMLGKRGG